MIKKSALPFLSLFTSASTLICCALPALFVALGAGAAFAGLVGTFPQLIWLSEHKKALFLFAGMMLIAAGVAQYQARNLPCPIDAAEAEACARARQWSKITYFISVVIFVIGVGFALIPEVFAHEGHHHESAPATDQQAVIYHQINDAYLKSVKPVFQKKCFDCHSNQTSFPWYHSLPLVGWYLDSDVKEGREHIDLSADFPFKGHGSPQDDLEAIASEIRKKEMPPFLYKLVHPAASLEAEEANAILEWTKESLVLLNPDGEKKPEGEMKKKGDTHAE